MVIRQLKKILSYNHFLLQNATFLFFFYFYHKQNYYKLKIDKKTLSANLFSLNVLKPLNYAFIKKSNILGNFLEHNLLLEVFFHF